MPGLDRMGPNNRGPMTGGGRGLGSLHRTPTSYHVDQGPAAGVQVTPPHASPPGFYARGRPRRGLAGGARRGGGHSHGRHR